MSRKKRIINFGLAGNPIHIGHIAVAKELTKHCDEVWLSPCYIHLHNKEMADANDRLKMCQLAANGLPNIKVCTYEVDHKLTVSSYEFLCQMRELYPDVDFSFAIGQDNADSIEKWKYNEELRSQFSAVVIPRIHELPLSEDRWYNFPPHKFLNNFKTLDISSTDIRSNLEVFKNALHPSVFQYIKAYQLY